MNPFLKRHKHTNIKKFKKWSLWVHSFSDDRGKLWEKKSVITNYKNSIYLYLIYTAITCMSAATSWCSRFLSCHRCFTIRPVFSEPSEVTVTFLPARSHTSRSGTNTERTADPLHFLVAQLQSPIPQEVLGHGPAVSRDTELFSHVNGLKPCGALCSFISSQCVGVFLISSWWDLCHFLLFMFWFYCSHRPAVWVLLIPTHNPEDIWVNDYSTEMYLRSTLIITM